MTVKIHVNARHTVHSSPKYYPQIFDLRYTTVLSTVVGLLSFEIFLLDKIVDRQISDEDFQVFMGSKVATCVPDPHLSSYMIGERPANASSTTSVEHSNGNNHYVS